MTGLRKTRRCLMFDLEVTSLSQQPCNSFNQRRIALFEPHLDLATNPSLVCLSKAFARSSSAYA